MLGLVGLLATGDWLSAAVPQPILSVPAGPAPLEMTVDLPDGFEPAASAAWQLVEVDDPAVIVPVQLVAAIAPDGTAGRASGRLIANVPPRDGAKAPRRFRLEAAKASPGSEQSGFQFKEVSDKSLAIWEGKRPVLVYNHGVITCQRVPEKDHRRRRGCYVHPVWGLGGEVLTDDFSKDHYHHHGIFWTWPHIGIAGKEYNLWAGNNIKNEFVRWVCRKAGPTAAVLGVENGWFVGEKKVMIERVWLEAYKASDSARSLDIELTWIPLDNPITLWGAGGKSYGGLTMPFAPPSNKDKNTVITVPSGRTDRDLPDTRLTWADFTSKFAGAAAPSGAAVFVHPGHPDYPPAWLIRHYGPLCVGWPGVKPKTFEPGEPIRLNYRIWIHKTAVQPAVLARAYDGYKATTAVKWE